MQRAERDRPRERQNQAESDTAEKTGCGVSECSDTSEHASLLPTGNSSTIVQCGRDCESSDKMAHNEAVECLEPGVMTTLVVINNDEPLYAYSESNLAEEVTGLSRCGSLRHGHGPPLTQVKRTSRPETCPTSPFPHSNNGHRDHDRSRNSQRRPPEDTRSDNRQHVAPRQSRDDGDGSPIVLCGQYLTRCVNPFLSVEVLVAVAHRQTNPGSTDQETYMSEERRKRHTDYWAAAVAFSPSLQTSLRQGHSRDVTKGLIRGTRISRSNDVYRLKLNTGRLASRTGAGLLLSGESKSDRGFNHNELGRMLIPVQHLKEYNNNPVGVRAKVNAGVKEYQVTSRDVPSFLYEDPEEYDPENVFAGFMRGYFLARALRAIFKGPKAALRRPSTKDKPPRSSVAHACRLETVTIPVMVYVAIQARFALSSQQSWSGKDGIFNYEDFAEMLLQVFEQDDEWKKDTIRWWNLELFGHENGLTSVESTDRSTSNSNDFLAKAMAQGAKRKTAARVLARRDRQDSPPTDTQEDSLDDTNPPPSQSGTRRTASGGRRDITPSSPPSRADQEEHEVTADENSNVATIPPQPRKRGSGYRDQWDYANEDGDRDSTSSQQQGQWSSQSQSNLTKRQKVANTRTGMSIPRY